MHGTPPPPPKEKDPSLHVEALKRLVQERKLAYFILQLRECFLDTAAIFKPEVLEPLDTLIGLSDVSSDFRFSFLGFLFGRAQTQPGLRPVVDRTWQTLTENVAFQPETILSRIALLRVPGEPLVLLNLLQLGGRIDHRTETEPDCNNVFRRAEDGHLGPLLIEQIIEPRLTARDSRFLAANRAALMIALGANSPITEWVYTKLLDAAHKHNDDEASTLFQTLYLQGNKTPKAPGSRTEYVRPMPAFRRATDSDTSNSAHGTGSDSDSDLLQPITLSPIDKPV